MAKLTWYKGACFVFLLRAAALTSSITLLKSQHNIVGQFGLSSIGGALQTQCPLTGVERKFIRG
jgi:hypothetical protein